MWKLFFPRGYHFEFSELRSMFSFSDLFTFLLFFYFGQVNHMLQNYVFAGLCLLVFLKIVCKVLSNAFFIIWKMRSWQLHFLFRNIATKLGRSKRFFNIFLCHLLSSDCYEFPQFGCCVRHIGYHKNTNFAMFGYKLIRKIAKN